MQLKKIIAGFSLAFLLLSHPAYVIAQEEPTPTPEPTPIVTQAPTPTETIQPTSTPEPTPTPRAPLPSPTRIPPPDNYQPPPTYVPPPSATTPTPTSTSSTPTTTPTPAPSAGSTGNQSESLGSGDTIIATGDVNDSATVVTTGNSNASGVAQNQPTTGIVNSNNGVASENTGSIAISDSSSTTQTNAADVNNSLTQNGVSGGNSASYNTGGTSAVLTGDSNVSGTAITAVNSNVDGVMVSEFNIADTHMGDYVLDFDANCIAGCTGSLEATNSGNGANSQNATNLDQASSSTTFQSNDATVGNNMVLMADTGYNSTSANTGGDNIIATGDANVSANALTFANTNIAGGQVKYGVVNIYGDLVGDIVFPEELTGGNCCLMDVTANNTSNGAGSTNNSTVAQSSTQSTDQTNTAVIENNLNIAAETGANDSTGNTGGSSTIATGDSNITAQVLNVANTNISSGQNLWLVLVNNAGQWMGQILGAPSGQNFAGSAGTNFIVGADGSITASNSGNGANSTNSTSVNSNSSETTTQTNTAHVVNNLDLSANTGHNDTNWNTNGNNYIQTGDANVVANLVNFVNNNIAGGGNLFVTVVNVFGSWMGNFVTPGSSSLAQSTSPHSPSVTPTPTPKSSTGGAEIALLSSTSTPTPPPTSTRTTASTTSTSPKPTKTPSNRLISYDLNTSSSPQVAGFVTQVDSYSPLDSLTKSTSSKRVVRINLAWLLLLLPVAGILALRKAKRSAA